MVTVQWPSLLPKEPIPTTFKEIEPNVLKRGEMAAGAAKTRRIISMGVVKLEVEFVLNLWHERRLPNGTVEIIDQRAIFLSFFRDTLRNGVRPFLFTHPVTKEPLVVRIVPKSDNEHFSMPYTAGRLITLALVFEVLP